MQNFYFYFFTFLKEVKEVRSNSKLRPCAAVVPRAKIEERERRERAGVNAVVGSWPAARGLACGEGLACGIFLGFLFFFFG